MFTSMVRRFLAAGGMAWAVLAFPGVAAAQDGDVREVQRYVLTGAGLAKYTQATKALAQLPAAKTRACSDEGDDEDDDDDGADDQSIGAMVAKFESVPGARAAVQGAGMTLREYVVFTLSLLQNGLASWAVQQPGGKLPPGVAKANVDFVQAHDAELKRLQQYSRNDDCPDADEGAEAADEGAEA